jgi:hypothetical protein
MKGGMTENWIGWYRLRRTYTNQKQKLWLSNGVNEVNDQIHTEIDRNKWWVAIQRSLDSPNQHWATVLLG